MPSYDFSDGLIPAEFQNATNRPWVIVADSSNPQSQANVMAATGGTDSSYSTIFIFGDFAAGNVTFDYKVSSEANFDFGTNTINGAVEIKTSGTPGSWTSASISISSGPGFIFFQYYKDGGGLDGDDDFMVSNLNTPAYTNLKDDFELFPSGLPSGWTNDGSFPWVAASTQFPFSGLRSATNHPDSTTSTVIYDSPSDSPAGTVMMIGTADSEGGFDFFKMFIDDSEVFSDSGEQFSAESGDYRGTPGLHTTVTSGTHEYKFEYSKDGSATAGEDAAIMWAFFEPSFVDVAPTDIVIFRRRIEGRKP